MDSVGAALRGRPFDRPCDLIRIGGCGEGFCTRGRDIEELRSYTEDYQHVIQLLEAASNMPHCDLAVPRSPQGISGKVRLKLTQQTRSAAVLIGANGEKTWCTVLFLDSNTSGIRPTVCNLYGRKNLTYKGHKS